MFARLAAVALSLTVVAAGPAFANDWHHRPHGPHHWGGTRVVIWQPAPVYPVPAYRPYPVYPVYAAPVPVYATAPVVVQTPAAVQAAPIRDFQDQSGRYCREYQRMAIIDGRQQQIYGTACMMPDGSWQVVSE